MSNNPQQSSTPKKEWPPTSWPPTQISPTNPDRTSRIIVFRPIVRKLTRNRVICNGCRVYNFENWEDVYLDPSKGIEFDWYDAADLAFDDDSPLTWNGCQYTLYVNEKEKGYELKTMVRTLPRITYPGIIPAGKALGPALAQILGGYTASRNQYGQISVVVKYRGVGFNPYQRDRKDSKRLLLPWPASLKYKPEEYSTYVPAPLIDLLSGEYDLPEEEQNLFEF